MKKEISPLYLIIFGLIVCFSTIWLSNKYNMPFLMSLVSLSFLISIRFLVDVGNFILHPELQSEWATRSQATQNFPLSDTSVLGNEPVTNQFTLRTTAKSIFDSQNTTTLSKLRFFLFDTKSFITNTKGTATLAIFINVLLLLASIIISNKTATSSTSTPTSGEVTTDVLKIILNYVSGMVQICTFGVLIHYYYSRNGRLLSEMGVDL